MILQPLIFSKDKTESPALFFRGSAVSGYPIVIKAGEKLSLDTYFNSFSYTKYRDHTRIDRVTARIGIKGGARISLTVFDGQKKTAAVRDVSCGDISFAELSADFSGLPENGFLYPEIEAKTDCEIQKIEYISDAEPDGVSCCGVICTYKREEYVLSNIRRLKNAGLSLISRVFVIDNGNTLDADGLSDSFISVLPNKNYGGSGGFTRGLIEAHKAGFSHVILMDDDIEFYPEVFERMTVFVSLLNEKSKNAWFSAAMLRKSDPSVQYEMGASWNKSVIDHKKHDVNICRTDTLLDNLDNGGLGYAAWWCLCMPLSIVDEQQLPYPFFIKFDDAEYGLRRKKDTPIITMNGVAVTHEDFENKFSFSLIYYDCRNQLITNSVTYDGKNLKPALMRLIKTCGKQLLLYRYDAVPLVIKAYSDFLKGAELLKCSNEEELNAQIISLSPKQTALDGHKIKRRPPEEYKKAGVLQGLTLAGHLIPAFLLKKEPLYVPISGDDTAECFRYRTLVQYQTLSDSGIVRRRSFAGFLRCVFSVLGTAVKLILGFSAADRSYKKHRHEITSMDFWEAHLDIKQ